MRKTKSNVKFYLIAIGICVFAVAGVVYGQDAVDNARTIVNNFYGNATITQGTPDSGNLVIGAVTPVSGVCTGSEPTTQLCNVNAGNLSVGDILEVGGVEQDWIEGSCADATTTILAVANPWGAAAYIDRMIISITGAATTTWTMDVGTSSTAFAAPTEVVVDDTGLATSTTGKFTNTSGTVATVGNYTDPGTNSQDIIDWGSAEYIVGLVTSTGGTAFDTGFTNAANTFTCTYKIHSFK